MGNGSWYLVSRLYHVFEILSVNEAVIGGLALSIQCTKAEKSGTVVY
jgi:hypothetical protein